MKRFDSTLRTAARWAEQRWGRRLQFARSDSRDIRLALAATWSKERPSGGEISPLGLARGKISPLSVGGELVDAIMTVGMMLLMWYVHLEPPGEE